MSTFEKIIAEARAGNELPVNRFFEDLYAKFKPRLIGITRSAQDADDIFMETIYKFWRDFVKGDKKLPDNIDGYLYVAAKNIWLDQLRKKERRKTVPIEYSPAVNTAVEPDVEYQQDLIEQENIEQKKQMAWHKAVQRMCDKCNQIYQEHIINNQKLSTLWKKMGYKNHQGIIQAKYNCKKELTKLFFEELGKV